MNIVPGCRHVESIEPVQRGHVLRLKNRRVTPVILGALYSLLTCPFPSRRLGFEFPQQQFMRLQADSLIDTRSSLTL